MSTLLVDNYDSYTYNVFHLLATVSGEEPVVVHNDMVSWPALSRWGFDAIVLSPGPGRPERWHDFGVCGDILRSAEVPVLGVCLGHQGLGHMLNRAVTSAPCAMHGRRSEIEHDGQGLFAGIPQGFSVVRYHSLAVTDSLGEHGRVTAWTDDGVVMAIEHRTRPMWGVQFHPESIATEYGHRLVENFYRLVGERGSARSRRPLPTLRRRAPAAQSPTGQVQVLARRIEGAPCAEVLFERLFGDAEHAFWLDSADAPSVLGRRSFLGTSAGPNRMVLEYDVQARTVTVSGEGPPGTERSTIFEVLERELAARQTTSALGTQCGFTGGFVGYLGYECKADCGSPNKHSSDMPDAAMMFANRLVAVDHVRGQTWVLAVCQAGEDASDWLTEAEAEVRRAMRAQPASDAELLAQLDGREEQVLFTCGRGREQYLADIARCQAALNAGESYEVCLTDQIHAEVAPDPWLLYRLLRRRNPAPFASYLKLGEKTIVSSSPERFLSVDGERRVQARPIKGTAPRQRDPARDEELRDWLKTDEKTFAEHLMIVDLLRNDLGRVCEVGSVEVPDFMVVESYATVHQLISNVTGLLAGEHSSVECVRACFPGGSMTGAPKLRTMEIIDDIEREARGVYSGAIGHFGLDGTVDLSIVIRTIVMRDGRLTIGAGGAIVMQSDAAEEFDELLLKARAPMAAVAEAVTGSRDEDARKVELAPVLGVPAALS